MGHEFTVTIDGDLSPREVEQASRALQKALVKWFKKGHHIRVTN